MTNVGIVKSKNSNHEKTPVRGFFLSRFFDFSLWWFDYDRGSGSVSVEDAQTYLCNLTEAEPELNRASLSSF